jgi:hypothetical protein
VIAVLRTSDGALACRTLAAGADAARFTRWVVEAPEPFLAQLDG